MRKVYYYAFTETYVCEQIYNKVIVSDIKIKIYDLIMDKPNTINKQ